MARMIRKRCCLRLKQSFILLCIISLLTLSVFYNYCNLLMTASIVFGHLSSNSAVVTAYNIVCNESSTRQTQEARMQSVSCNQHQERSNWTSCPQCFRQSVTTINNHVREIGFQDHLIPDRPANYFKASPEVVETLVTDYLIVPRFECPYLLALQPSIPDRQHQRDTVRSTWGSVAKEQKWPNRKINAKVNIIFVIGSHLKTVNYSDIDASVVSEHISVGQIENIKSEAETHNDILYLDMIDSYRNLTLKLLSAFKWIKDNCPCVKFVLKVDDDTFVNVPLLVDVLLHIEDRVEFSILGMVYTSISRVMRAGPWGVSNTLYPMQLFPEYSSGCGYVLSSKVLSQIVDVAPHFRIFLVEDAFITGVLRRVIGCKMFSLSTLMTHHNDRGWNSCHMLNDLKILGMSEGGRQHHPVWDSFVRGTCN